MLSGQYVFNTNEKEIMEIISGDLEIILPQEQGWKTIGGGMFSKSRLILTSA